MKPEILLKAYVQYQSDEAFRELVAGSLDEVYSTALHIIQGPENLIEEAVLRAYWELARKAPRLGRDVMVDSWLREHTCRMAVAVLHEEDRSVDRATLKTEKEALSTLNIQPAPPGLATRVCQGILLNAAQNKRGLFLPRLMWPAWVRPVHIAAAAALAIILVCLWKIPFHKRNPIVQAPEVEMTPASFAQLASPEEGAPAHFANTNVVNNPNRQ